MHEVYRFILTDTTTTIVYLWHVSYGPTTSISYHIYYFRWNVAVMMIMMDSPVSYHTGTAVPYRYSSSLLCTLYCCVPVPRRSSVLRQVWYVYVPREVFIAGGLLLLHCCCITPTAVYGYSSTCCCIIVYIYHTTAVVFVIFPVHDKYTRIDVYTNTTYHIYTSIYNNTRTYIYVYTYIWYVPAMYHMLYLGKYGVQQQVSYRYPSLLRAAVDLYYIRPYHTQSNLPNGGKI